MTPMEALMREHLAGGDGRQRRFAAARIAIGFGPDAAAPGTTAAPDAAVPRAAKPRIALGVKQSKG